MNPDKLKSLQNQVRIGGKGTVRRKKKVVHRSATTDDKKLQSSLKKMPVNTIPGIEEVNMIKDDGSVIHFTNPKVQASLAANTFAVGGHADTKQVADLLPGIFNQLGPESVTHLKKLASNVGGPGAAAGAGGYAGSGILQDPFAMKQMQHKDVNGNNDDDLDHADEVVDATAAAAAAKGGDEADEDDIPDLVGNFDDASKTEAKVSIAATDGDDSKVKGA